MEPATAVDELVALPLGTTRRYLMHLEPVDVVPFSNEGASKAHGKDVLP